MSFQDAYIKLGTITKIHSAKGVLKAKLDLPEDFSLEHLIQSKLWLSKKQKRSCQFTLSDLRRHKGFYLLKLAEINSYQLAEELIKQDVYFPRKIILENLGAEYFLVQELVGLKVFEIDSEEPIGKVLEFVKESQENQLLRIELKTKNKFLLPLVKEFILKIDLKQQKLWVTQNWSELIV